MRKTVVIVKAKYTIKKSKISVNVLFFSTTNQIRASSAGNRNLTVIATRVRVVWIYESLPLPEWIRISAIAEIGKKRSGRSKGLASDTL
jgi:hypothetical protein